MERIKTIFQNDSNIIIQGEENGVNIPVSDFSIAEKIIIGQYKDLCSDKLQKSLPLIPLPEGDNVYTMIQPCPMRADLTVKVWDSNYQNDKEAKVITINVTALHFDENGDRVPQFDGKSYVLADMSEDHKVEVSPDVLEYSYVLANTMLDNGQPINQLIHQAIQIADADGSLNKRLYNL